MDNKKTDQYYIDKIITDLTFIRTHTESLSKSKLEDADHYTSHTNEVIVAFTGDASAVESAVRSARTIGLDLLRKLGSEAKPVGVPYLD